VGQLICFAVNTGQTEQISHNHLSGRATVQTTGFSPAYEYASWNFAARGVAEGSPVGTAGRLDLTGASGAYDACPAYNVLQFFPAGAAVFGHTYLDTEISVSTCLQDLRETFPPTPHFTRLLLTVWNAFEQKFTGAWECTANTHNFRLTTIDFNPNDVGSVSSLGTETALLQLRDVGGACDLFGIPRTSESTGLVAVGATVLDFGPSPNVATNTNSHGTHKIDGFVLWTPALPDPE
jgi:hypothetical protein